MFPPHVPRPDKLYCARIVSFFDRWLLLRTTNQEIICVRKKESIISYFEEGIILIDRTERNWRATNGHGCRHDPTTTDTKTGRENYKCADERGASHRPKPIEKHSIQQAQDPNKRKRMKNQRTKLIWRKQNTTHRRPPPRVTTIKTHFDGMTISAWIHINLPWRKAESKAAPRVSLRAFTMDKPSDKQKASSLEWNLGLFEGFWMH